jgi:hypothetical protein
VKANTIEYKTDSRINNQDFPVLNEQLAGGIVIQMPLTGIKEYLRRLISVD